MSRKKLVLDLSAEEKKDLEATVGGQDIITTDDKEVQDYFDDQCGQEPRRNSGCAGHQ